MHLIFEKWDQPSSSENVVGLGGIGQTFCGSGWDKSNLFGKGHHWSRVYTGMDGIGQTLCRIGQDCSQEWAGWVKLSVGVGGIGQECLQELVGLDQYSFISRQNWSRVSVCKRIGQIPLGASKNRV